MAGPSPQTAVREHGPLPVETVWALGAGLAEGLLAIHAFGVVHRDLKSSNIIIASDGPRVIDFGIARALEMASLTGPSVVLGTPSFMSPEQVLAREHGPPGDVFALGSVLAFAATGRGAFAEGHPWAVLNSVVHSEPNLAQVPDDTLLGVIAACLAKDPEVRPGLEELLTWLLDPAPTAQAWLPPAVRDLTDSYSVKDPTPAGPDHARNVATAFAEASAALYAAADVNVPDAGSIFDDHR